MEQIRCTVLWCSSVAIFKIGSAKGRVSPRWRFWGICLHAPFPTDDWSMMRDFFPDPMAQFHGAENNTRGSTVCCLEPSSGLPSGTTHMQVNNMELGRVSKKKANTESAHRNRTDRSVQRSGIFERQMMEDGGAHRIRGCSGFIWQKSTLRQIRSYLVGAVYFGAWNCHFV